MCSRFDRNEKDFTEAEKLAWDFILPYKHIPILEEDYDKVNSLIKLLDPLIDEKNKYKTALDDIQCLATEGPDTLGGGLAACKKIYITASQVLVKKE